MSTVTNETKIKPIPFFSFKIDDYVNLPENYNNSFHFFCGNMDDPTKVYDNVRRKHVTFISRKFKPEKSCYIKVFCVTFSVQIYYKKYYSLVKIIT